MDIFQKLQFGKMVKNWWNQKLLMPYVVNQFCRREQQRNDTTPRPTRVVFDSRAMRGARAVFDAHAIRGAHVECANVLFSLNMQICGQRRKT